MTDWKFQRRQQCCAECERAFAEGERHASLLSIDGEALARADICNACWPGVQRKPQLFHWFTSFHAGRRAMQLDLALLEQLFVGLENREETKLRELRYVLCLLLMRKRRLKLDRIVRAERGASDSMLVKRPRRKEAFRVFSFDFTAERTAELRTELLEILGGGDLPSWPTAESGADERGSPSPMATQPEPVLLESSVESNTAFDRPVRA